MGRYKTVLGEFAAFVRDRAGHADPKRVEKADVVAWRDALLGEGKAAKTVRDTQLAALRAIFERARRDGVLVGNPAAEVDVGGRHKGGPQEGDKGFTDAEARAILTAALSFKRADHAPHTAAAIRWTPWLGAYMGLRIAEAVQLRGKSVREENDGWIVRLSPEDGSIKSGTLRDVPVHPHLVELGFIEFVRSAGPGPLFCQATAEGLAKNVNGVSQQVGKWVRGIVSDTRVQPTHGWRHRFKTIAREVGMDAEKRDYMLGHALPGMGGTYGDMRGLRAEIEKLPRYTVG